MPIKKIRFLGGKLGEALADEFVVITVGELEHITLSEYLLGKRCVVC